MQNGTGVFEEADVCKSKVIEHLYTLIPTIYSQDSAYDIPTFTIARPIIETKSATPKKLSDKSYTRIIVKPPSSARKTPTGAIKRKKSAKRLPYPKKSSDVYDFPDAKSFIKIQEKKRKHKGGLILD